jgi:hypothetical protein
MDNILKIRMIEVPISLAPVKVLAPEFLTQANKPLAIRAKYTKKAGSRYMSHIQVWSWDQPLVSMTFLTVKDDVQVGLAESGLRMRRHFGTVFDSEGNAIHLLSLYKSGD